MATPPLALPPGHSYFAYGRCPHCFRAPRVRENSAMTYQEVLDDMKGRMSQHIQDKHSVEALLEHMGQHIPIFSARYYSSPNRVNYAIIEDPSATAGVGG